jgi:hypothetical protein
MKLHRKVPGFNACAHALPAAASFFLCLVSMAQNPKKSTAEVRFKKHVITNDFISEGVAVGDINRDGKVDIIAGAYWFEAPTWKRHQIAEAHDYSATTGFSNSFLDFCMDVNQDGWPDLIRFSLPGEEVVWYENPGNKPGLWIMHPLLQNAGNESPTLVDIDGDGRPDILCNDPIAKEMIWLKSPSQKGDTLWKRYIIAKGDIPGVDRYTHGLGWADMNGDGRPDVIITKGWWETPVDPTQSNWIFHPADLGDDCSQIYAMDIKGTGNLDLISASAHKYGIWWHEKTRDANGGTVWLHHTIFSGFSQSHGLAMADINADGYPDLVTGKRYFAHNGKDPGAFEPSVLYWFEFKPGKRPEWIAHPIDDNSGVGLQVITKDMNQDGLMDIVVANKKGVFFFEQLPR